MNPYLWLKYFEFGVWIYKQWIPDLKKQVYQT